MKSAICSLAFAGTAVAFSPSAAPLGVQRVQSSAPQISMVEGASTRRAMLAGLLVGVPAAANAMTVPAACPSPPQGWSYSL